MHSINLPVLIDFYDRKVSRSLGHATAVNAVLGEDLAIALFCDYAKREGLSPIFLSGKCNQGKNKGKRLDCWIQVTDGASTVHYQTEIKNWSAHAFSGKVIPSVESDENMVNFRKSRWENQFDNSAQTLKQDPARKVLIPMKALDPSVEIRPLIIFWDAMHPNGEPKEFFSVPVSGSSFGNLWFFSMSTYVRNQINKGILEIKIEMPEVNERIEWLRQIYA